MKQSEITSEFDYLHSPFTKSIAHIFGQANAYLSSLPRWEKAFHIWWLLGPFILLIERSPADLWLSLCVIGFITRAIIKKTNRLAKGILGQSCVSILGCDYDFCFGVCGPVLCVWRGLYLVSFSPFCYGSGILAWHK